MATPFVCLAPSYGRKGAPRRPKGQESIAKGLPWVSQNKRFALKLKGRETRTRSGFKGLEPMLAVPGGPFRTNSGGGNYPGKF
jgi:hypothetical protein